MNAAQFSNALGKVNCKYIMEAVSYERKTKSGWQKWVALAACFCLILTAAMMTLPGILQGPGGVAPLPNPSPNPNPGLVSSGEKEDPSGDSVPQPSNEQSIVINWDNVAVNEAEQLTAEGALKYYDPALYDKEIWNETEITDYLGRTLMPNYIPEGLIKSGDALSGTVIRSKESGELVRDQMCQDFWRGFYEDGSPKSNDDIIIPTGFTLTASKLGIFHCGILPTEEIKITDFGGIPVTLVHCSMPHGPYDQDNSHTPAGYYDVYQATFELSGVHYEVAAQRLDLEEVIKITASFINMPYQENFTVGRNNKSTLSAEAE